MIFDNPQNKLICVFGLGLSGLSTARYLQRIKQEFFVVDSRANPPGKEALAELSYCTSSYYGEMPQQQLDNAAVIILSPGVSPKLEPLLKAAQSGVRIIGDIEVFAKRCKKKIVAITGSNGKSTVTDLTCKLIQAAGINAVIGGNFGKPVLDYLPQDNADIYVLELSSFQLDTTVSLKADVAVVLNVTEDHMDRYQSFEQYRDSKLTIFNGAKSAIANADDKHSYFELENKPKLFSLVDQSSAYHIDADKNLLVDGQNIICGASLKLTGEHNLSNALVSLAILNELNIDISPTVLSALKEYTGLAHRFQLVEKSEAIEWVNDSKATNVGATEAALRGIDNSQYSKVVLIAGGDAKGADLSGLKKILGDRVSHLVLIGKDAKLFAPLMPADKIYFASDMCDAVNHARDYVLACHSEKISRDKSKPGLILLSPACASLDMYKNFEVRGQAFVDAIKECA